MKKYNTNVHSNVVTRLRQWQCPATVGYSILLKRVQPISPNPSTGGCPASLWKPAAA